MSYPTTAAPYTCAITNNNKKITVSLLISSSSSNDADPADDTSNDITVSINGDDYTLDQSSWTGSFDRLGQAHGGGVLTVTIVLDDGERLHYNTDDDNDDVICCDLADKCYDLTGKSGNKTDDHTCNNDNSGLSCSSNMDGPMVLIDVYQCVFEHGVVVGPILVHLADGSTRYATCDEDGKLHGACITTTSDGVVMVLDYFDHGVLAQLRPLEATTGTAQVAHGLMLQ